MSAPIKPIAALDVPLPDVEAHMAEQGRIACLWVARLHTSDESEQAAFALDVRLIETHAAVATDADYPAWAAQLAALPTYHRAEEASHG